MMIGYLPFCLSVGSQFTFLRAFPLRGRITHQGLTLAKYSLTRIFSADSRWSSLCSYCANLWMTQWPRVSLFWQRRSHGSFSFVFNLDFFISFVVQEAYLSLLYFLRCSVFPLLLLQRSLSRERHLRLLYLRRLDLGPWFALGRPGRGRLSALSWQLLLGLWAAELCLFLQFHFIWDWKNSIRWLLSWFLRRLVLLLQIILFLYGGILGLLFHFRRNDKGSLWL